MRIVVRIWGTVVTFCLAGAVFLMSYNMAFDPLLHKTGESLSASMYLLSVCMFAMASLMLWFAFETALGRGVVQLMCD